MGLFPRQGYLQCPAFGGESGRIIPLHVIRSPIVQVGGFPVWVVTGVECPTVGVELVRKDELHVAAVIQSFLGKGFRGGVLIYQPMVSRNLWDLEGELTTGTDGKLRIRA